MPGRLPSKQHMTPQLPLEDDLRVYQQEEGSKTMKTAKPQSLLKRSQSMIDPGSFTMESNQFLSEEHSQDGNKHPQVRESSRPRANLLTQSSAELISRPLLIVEEEKGHVPPENDRKYVFPTDQELEKLLEQLAPPITLDASTIELGRKIFPTTMTEFFNTFLSL